VLVAAAHRHYAAFPNPASQQYAEGILFFAANGTPIVNYPKQHSANCTAKHKDTKQWFKPTVRVFKNMRNRLVADGLLADGLAPSYFVEGMLHNAPSDLFGASYVDTFVKTFNWISSADRSKLVCANGRHWLLRDGQSVCWSEGNCSQFLAAAREYWNNG
jgi:hypothetical protein